MDEMLKLYALNQLRETIKGKEFADAVEIVAGEIYMRQRHLAEFQRQTDRLNDEIAEFRKFDVDAELKKQKI